MITGTWNDQFAIIIFEQTKDKHEQHKHMPHHSCSEMWTESLKWMNDLREDSFDWSDGRIIYISIFTETLVENRSNVF